MAIDETRKEFLQRLAKGIAALFGSNCEVTVHDLTGSYESTIIAIENGQVTNRRVGDGASEIVLQALKNGRDQAKDHYSYLTRTKEGRMLKSSSIFIKDDEGHVVGLLGINYDISDLMMANAAINAAITVGDEDDNSSSNSIDTITTNVNDLLDQLIDDSTNFVGKPVALMNKEDKIRAIQYLDERGAFLIKKSGDRVAKHYDISKYTLYNYMDSEK